MPRPVVVACFFHLLAILCCCLFGPSSAAAEPAEPAEYVAFLSRLVGGDVRARGGRLAVALLSAEPSTQRDAEACCAIKQLRAHLLPSTPSDILLFYLPASAANAHGGTGNGSSSASTTSKPPAAESEATLLASRFCAATGADHLHFLPIHPTHWQAGAWAQKGHPHYGGSLGSSGYMLMGQWRLLHQFSLLSSLGYEYALQYDTDSHLLAPVEFDLVQHLSFRGIYMAGRNSWPDKAEVT